MDSGINIQRKAVERTLRREREKLRRTGKRENKEFSERDADQTERKLEEEPTRNWDKRTAAEKLRGKELCMIEDENGAIPQSGENMIWKLKENVAKTRMTVKVKKGYVGLSCVL